MAGHQHDDHHLTEQKPVSFTVPFILASVVILIIVLLLSVCDPKSHQDHHGMENPAHSKFEGHINNPNERAGDQPEKGDQATTTTTDTGRVEAPVQSGSEHH
jgi:hypothetical protein